MSSEQFNGKSDLVAGLSCSIWCEQRVFNRQPGGCSAQTAITGMFGCMHVNRESPSIILHKCVEGSIAHTVLHEASQQALCPCDCVFNCPLTEGNVMS